MGFYPSIRKYKLTFANLNSGLKEGMYLKRLTHFLVLCLLITSFKVNSQTAKNLLPYVNPFIGTGGHGHTFPGACYPFGMMQLSPDTRLTGWDGCSGYHYSDNVIYGFTHTHLSGTGCSDYGDILLMPTPSLSYKSKNGSIFLEPYSYSATFSHQNEKASPGYYSVTLENGIKIELTVGERAGMHRYVFPKNDSCNIVLDLQHRDLVLGSELTIVSDTEIAGYRRSKAWAQDQWVYFDIRFSRPIETTSLFDNAESIAYKNHLESKNIKAVFHFKQTDTIIVKVGISAVSTINAAANLSYDLSGWNFEKTLKKTQAAWNNYLGKIEVSNHKDSSLLTTFYTALYHTAIHPSLYTDANGDYRGRDNKIHNAQGYSIYTVFSLWDTYRALHPLYTIIAPSMDGQFIQTFLKQYEQGGLLPVWELSANETNCMIGYHAVPIIADAFQKKIYGYDIGEALRAMYRSATDNKPGENAFRKYGYVPSDKDAESVSKTLEYAYDDWCIALVAKWMGNMAEYQHYITLAQNYKNVFDPATGFMRARVNGAWYVPFDAREVNSNYTEANAWQYTFYVPQDVSGLIKLYGGKERMSQKLDSLFTVSSLTTGREQSDISGMIGQYAQGNEPSHHMAYLYNYLGEPWKTADYVRKIEALYTSTPEGLCGNEDCGQMSAWYVMSAIGMYQVCPGDGQFILTTPLFDTIKIHLENGNTFSIISRKESAGATYIASSALNQRYYAKSYLPYDTLVKGGTLKYDVSASHPDNWGRGNNVPVDSIEGSMNIIPQPYAKNGSPVFRDSIKVELKAYNPSDKIYYTLDDSTPDMHSTLYTKPFSVDRTVCVKSVACRGNACSIVNTTCYTKIPGGMSIDIKSKPKPEYTAGGPDALIDNQRGTTNFRLGKWQGYWGQNFEAVVDLGKEREIRKVGAEFLQDAGAWILMPQYVDFYTSQDGRNFTQVAHINNTVSDTNMTPTITIFKKDIPPRKIKYIKVFAKNYGKLPASNAGVGNDAYIFIDEILMK